MDRINRSMSINVCSYDDYVTDKKVTHNFSYQFDTPNTFTYCSTAITDTLFLLSIKSACLSTYRWK